MKKIALIPIIYGLFLAGSLAYSALDTFVIERTLKLKTSYYNPYENESVNINKSNKSSKNSIIDPTSSNENHSTSIKPYSYEDSSSSSSQQEDWFSDTVIQTENLYVDQNVRVEIKKEVIQTLLLKGEGTRDTLVYSADIRISHRTHFKTDFVKDEEGWPKTNKEEKASVMARANNAPFAINGDTFGAQKKGYVVRNGQLFRQDRRAGTDDLIVYGDGSFEMRNEDDYKITDLMKDNPYQVFSFGPALVNNGVRVVEKGTEVAIFDAKNNNQRVSIGIVEPLHYVVAVCDARLTDSYGMQLFEMADYMIGLGAQIAYNLDGGGSASFVFNGELLNRPCTYPNQIEERGVSDIIFFA